VPHVVQVLAKRLEKVPRVQGVQAVDWIVA